MSFEMHCMSTWSLFWDASMLWHGTGIGYMGPGHLKGPTDNFSLVTGSVINPRRAMVVTHTNIKTQVHSSVGLKHWKLMDRCFIFPADANLHVAHGWKYCTVSDCAQNRPAPIFGSHCSRFHLNRFIYFQSYSQTHEGLFCPVEFFLDRLLE